MGISVQRIIMTTSSIAWKFTLLVVAFSSVSAVEESVPKRDQKQLSLFSIVTFQNLDCKSQDSGRNGTCYTSTECGDKGGKKSGNCAAGFGVCCLFIYSTSGSTISQNCSYIQSPNFPSTFTSTDATSLTYTIAKCSNDVCALRLDLVSFTTQRGVDATPTEAQSCGDAFTITTTSKGTSGEICGENAGQHIYYELGKDAGATATLAFTVSSAAAVAGNTRSFEMKVTQIPCAVNYRPPSGCFQYHTGLTGTIKTFNYDASAAANQIHLANQRYDICVRQEEGMCCIQYTLCDQDLGLDNGAWALDSAIDSGTPATVAGTMTGMACTGDDTVIIDGAQANCDANEFSLTTALCGRFFTGAMNALAAMQAESVCDCSLPFNVGIVTDADAEAATTGVTTRRGVCLNYMQLPC